MSVDDVKRRLAPWLDEPYFDVVDRIKYMGMRKCDHRDFGVRLDVPVRRVYCRGCGVEVDPFDALIGYGEAERRLQHDAQTIRNAQQKETEKAAREKARKPHLQKVVKWEAIRDKRLVAKPVTGYVVTLACGHKTTTKGDRRYQNITCGTCVRDATQTTP